MLGTILRLEISFIELWFWLQISFRRILMILINNENQNHFLHMCRALTLRHIKGSHTV